jgi:hypothetical protein
MALDRRTALAAMGAMPLVAGTGRARSRPPGDLLAQDLRVEGVDEPAGLDLLRPRFSWGLAARDPNARGLVQRGFELIGGDDRACVAAGHGTRWAGSPTAGGQTLVRPSADLPLDSHRRYWWAVRVFDGAGRPGAWSAPASFLTGVLDPARWPDRWIAAEPDPVLLPHRQGQASPAMVPARLCRSCAEACACLRRRAGGAFGLWPWPDAAGDQRTGGGARGADAGLDQLPPPRSL